MLEIGTKAPDFTLPDQDGQLEYAQDKVRILSGLYGVLRPLDGVIPYRLVFVRE